MGFSENEYQSFKILNRDVIKAAIKEINEVSSFLVEVEYKKQGRRVVAVKFKVKKLTRITSNDTEQKDFFPEDTDMEGIALELHQAGMSRGEALRVFNQGWEYVDVDKRPEGVTFEDYIREKIHLLKTAGNVESKGGFLRTAIKEDYTNQKFKEVKRGKVFAQINQEIDDFESQIDEIRKERDEKAGAIYQQVLDEIPDVLDKALEMAFEEHPPLRDSTFYKQSQTPLENYQRSPFISNAVHKQLRKLHPDQFEEIDGYDKRIAAFEKATEEAKEKRKKV